MPEIPPSLKQFMLTNILNKIAGPTENWAHELPSMIQAWSPNLQITHNPERPGVLGSWNDITGVNLGDNDPTTLSHELAHELQWKTGIGQRPGLLGDVPYRYGHAPENVTEGAADVMSGGRTYFDNLSPEDRSKAHSLALMTLAAAREKQGK